MSRDHPSPGAEGHWSEWAASGDEEADEDAAPSVASLVRQQLVEGAEGAVEVSAVTVTAQQDQTLFLVVTYRDSGGAAGAKLWQRTVVVDLADQSVRLTDNALWVPADTGRSEALLSGLARATSDLSGSVGADAPPLAQSAVEGVDAEDVLATEVRDEPPAPGTEGSDVQGRPDALTLLDRRLREAGVSVSERYLMLDFYAKAPFKDHSLRVSEDSVKGNYGVYTTKDDPLVIVDVDRPDDVPSGMLPPTFTTTSPHGPASRCHRYYVVPDIEAVQERFGVWNPDPGWGEIQVSNKYVLGPGCQLDAEGCDTGEYEPGEPEGCDRCSDPDGGFYAVVDNREVATLPAEDLIELVEESGGHNPTSDAGSSGDAEAAQSDAEREEPEPDREGTEPGDADETVRCCRCDREIAESAAEEVARDGDRVAYGCRGGCT